MRVDLLGFYDFDVHSLCLPQIVEVDVLDGDVEYNFRVVDKGSDHDDNEDSDFRECQSDRSKESKSFSFNEGDDLEFENELSDDIDLESNTQLRITLRHGNIDDDDASEDLLIVNKMAKVFRHKLWTKNRDAKVSLNVGDIFTSKEELLDVTKDYCVQHGITLRKIKNTRSRYT